MSVDDILAQLAGPDVAPSVLSKLSAAAAALTSTDNRLTQSFTEETDYEHAWALPLVLPLALAAAPSLFRVVLAAGAVTMLPVDGLISSQVVMFVPEMALAVLGNRLRSLRSLHRTLNSVSNGHPLTADDETASCNSITRVSSYETLALADFMADTTSPLQPPPHPQDDAWAAADARTVTAAVLTVTVTGVVSYAAAEYRQRTVRGVEGLLPQPGDTDWTNVLLPPQFEPLPQLVIAALQRIVLTVTTTEGSDAAAECECDSDNEISDVAERIAIVDKRASAAVAADAAVMRTIRSINLLETTPLEASRHLFSVRVAADLLRALLLPLRRVHLSAVLELALAAGADASPDKAPLPHHPEQQRQQQDSPCEDSQFSVGKAAIALLPLLVTLISHTAHDNYLQSTAVCAFTLSNSATLGGINAFFAMLSVPLHMRPTVRHSGASQSAHAAPYTALLSALWHSLTLSVPDALKRTLSKDSKAL